MQPATKYAHLVTKHTGTSYQTFIDFQDLRGLLPYHTRLHYYLVYSKNVAHSEANNQDFGNRYW
eukprot:scaffold3576_cov170-Amphora_coffeaeformis.AAC.2